MLHIQKVKVGLLAFTCSKTTSEYYIISVFVLNNIYTAFTKRY